MAFRDKVRAITPQFLLDVFRANKRNKTRNAIQEQLQNGEALSNEELVNELTNLGIKKGDHVLVHCAFSKLGAVEGGPQTFINALQFCIGETGNLLMPSSPNASYQLEYIQNLELFDVDEEPSKMGVVSEVFRKSKDVFRSSHPTEPVCAWGNEAEWYTKNHENDGTAYGPNSPFKKLADKGGKILYIGVTLDTAGTSLHVLEDTFDDFKFPVYLDKDFQVNIKKGSEIKTIITKVHNPEQSKKRNCDGLLPMFEKKHVAQKLKLGNATTWVFDADLMLSVMIEAYENSGVTMYTPKGE